METGTEPQVETETEPVEVDTSAETTTENEPQEEQVHESVQDTVKKAYEELKNQGENAGNENQDAPPEPKLVGKDPKTGKFVSRGKAPKVTQQPQTTPAGQDAFLAPPPERLSAEGKAAYMNLPPALKRELHKTIKDLESVTTTRLQEVASIKEAVSPYINEWAEMGRTPAQAMMQLATAHHRLMDPKTSLQTFLKMGMDLGHLERTQQGIVLKSGGTGGQPTPSATDIASHPQFKALQDKLNSVESSLAQQRAQQQAEPIYKEMVAVQNETDGAGNLVYPELRNPEFLETVKPLVSALVRNVPGLSHGDALKHATLGVRRDASSLENAYKASLASVFQNGASKEQSNPTSLPSNNQTNNFNSRALNAAVSVRGKTSSSSSSLGLPDNIPDGVRDTVQLAYDNLKRGLV